MHLMFEKFQFFIFLGNRMHCYFAAAVSFFCAHMTGLLVHGQFSSIDVSLRDHENLFMNIARKLLLLVAKRSYKHQ